MKNFILLFALLLWCTVGASGQISVKEVIPVTSDPVGTACVTGKLYYNSTTGENFERIGGVCSAITSGGTPGTVTSVSGTANQISVATGTTTPVLSFPSGAVISENFVSGFATQATAAGTTTLTVASKRKQAFTGSTTQTVTLPVVSTLPQVGFSFDILNDSSGAVTVNSSGGNAVQVMAGSTRATFTAILLTGTTTASWDVTYVGGFQPLDSDLTTIAGLTATTDNFLQSKSSAWTSRTVAQVSADLQGTGLLTDAVGYRTIPQNSKSAAYSTAAADSGKHIFHPASDANARTFTIDGTVAYPVGTAISFVNMTAEVVTIAIASDTMYLAGAGTTGSRSLAQYGVATAIKISATEWIISGNGLT